MGILFLVSTCKKTDEIQIFDKEPILTVRTTTHASITPNSIFLSNSKGEVLSCKEFSNEFILENQIPLIDEYKDVSLVTGHSNIIHNYRIETFKDIEFQDWNFKKYYATHESEDLERKITFVTDESINKMHKAIVYKCGGLLLANLKDIANDSTKFDLNCGYLFILVKFPDESEYRFKEFNNVSDGDSILLDLDNFELGILEDLKSIDSDSIRATWLSGFNEIGSFKNSIRYYSTNITVHNYKIANGKIWYPPAIFEEYFVRLEMFKDNFRYIFENRGAPIYEYNPVPPDLELEGTGVDSFRIKSNSLDADFVSATWEIDKPEGRIEWTVYQEIEDPNFYELPKLPECAITHQEWFSYNDFKLKSIQSYHYENYNSLKEYINSRYGSEEGGEGEVLILTGGNFELKSVLN